MENYILLALATWLIIALTHGLTLAYNTPIIKQEVVEVRYMPQQSEVHSFKQEWQIDEQLMMRPYFPEQMKHIEDRAMREAFSILWDSIPKDMYEVYAIEDIRMRGKVYGIKVKIIPPVNGYRFNGEYYTKNHV